MKKENLCPICKVNQADRFTCVDVYSNTDIPACSDCAGMMSKAMRHQWNRDMPKRWREEHKQRLDNAWDALIAQYEHDAETK